MHFEKLLKVIPLSHGRESNFDGNKFNESSRENTSHLTYFSTVSFFWIAVSVNRRFNGI